MTKKLKIVFLTIFILGLSLALASPVLAASWIGFELIPTGCTKPGTTIESCGLTQVFEMIVNFSKLILALSGSAALLMFMYGGVLWIIAAGNQERIQKGKTALAAAALGLVIILSAWLIINTTICALTSGDVGCDQGKIFGSFPWFYSPETQQQYETMSQIPDISEGFEAPDRN